MGSDAASASKIEPCAHSPWCDHTGGQHAVQFYASDAFLVDGLADFIGTALGMGQGKYGQCSSARAVVERAGEKIFVLFIVRLCHG